jgi:hypothetical protein
MWNAQGAVSRRAAAWRTLLKTWRHLAEDVRIGLADLR